MHSNRMRNVRCSSRLLGEVSAQRGVCPEGGYAGGGLCLLGGLYPGGCLPSGGSCLPGWVSALRLVCPGGGVCLVCQTSPPWTEFLTHASENITFPQLRMRAVINLVFIHKLCQNFRKLRPDCHAGAIKSIAGRILVDQNMDTACSIKSDQTTNIIFTIFI